MAELPTELDNPPLSPFVRVVQSELGMFRGDSGTLDASGGVNQPFRPGIFTPRRPPTVGDDSGEDCSARMEWCKFVAAREKSSPRERRGSTDAGEGYAEEQSGFGDTGILFDRLAVLVLLRSRGGICRLNPRGGWFGRFGVTGMGERWLSSFEALLFSIKVGDGDSIDLIPRADHGRGLRGDIGRGSSILGRGSTSLPVGAPSTPSCCFS